MWPEYQYSSQSHDYIGGEKNKSFQQRCHFDASNNVIHAALYPQEAQFYGMPWRRCRLCEHEKQIMDNIGISPNTKHMIHNKIKEEESHHQACKRQRGCLDDLRNNRVQ